ncbi:hypothetical protein ACFLEY_11420 [Bradyrhizobium sp. YCK136]|uniref:hypothetical protein n=1 Tax=Bradyrhizobium TaxID=374 RepID=UPI0037CB42AE
MRNDRAGRIGPADRDENRRALDQLTQRGIGRTGIGVFSGQGALADRLRLEQHSIDVFERHRGMLGKNGREIERVGFR